MPEWLIKAYHHGDVLAGGHLEQEDARDVPVFDRVILCLAVHLHGLREELEVVLAARRHHRDVCDASYCLAHAGKAGEPLQLVAQLLRGERGRVRRAYARDHQPHLVQHLVRWCHVGVLLELQVQVGLAQRAHLAELPHGQVHAKLAIHHDPQVRVALDLPLAPGVAGGGNRLVDELHAEVLLHVRLQRLRVLPVEAREAADPSAALEAQLQQPLAPSADPLPLSGLDVLAAERDRALMPGLVSAPPAQLLRRELERSRASLPHVEDACEAQGVARVRHRRAYARQAENTFVP
mmetsp:Transcript_19059/g.48897  ORF Transcript_19059/g.48897 Transcript_19059/m.48897 type:complete len:293 (+) Transcript_19059:795-1673(+)